MASQNKQYQQEWYLAKVLLVATGFLGYEQVVVGLSWRLQ